MLNKYHHILLFRAFVFNSLQKFLTCFLSFFCFFFRGVLLFVGRQRSSPLGCLFRQDGRGGLPARGGGGRAQCQQCEYTHSRPLLHAVLTVMAQRGKTARDKAVEKNKPEVAAYLEEQMRLVSCVCYV